MKRQLNKLKLAILLFVAASFGSQVLAQPYYNGQDVGGTKMVACYYKLTATTGFIIIKGLVLINTTYAWQYYGPLPKEPRLSGWYTVGTANEYYPTAIGRYRVVTTTKDLSTNITTTKYSDEVTITGFGVPSVSSITVPTESCNGMVTLVANANSFTGATIDWKKYSNGSWIVIPGDGNTLRPTFSISDINNYSLQVTVTNACATSSVTTTTPASIKMLNTETVTLNTASKNLCLNEVGIISAVVGNANVAYVPSYQYLWQYSANNGATWTTITSSAGIYSNYTTKDLSIKPADASINSYQYRCTVTGRCATVTSTPCTVSVKTPPSVSSLTAPGLACKNTTSSATVALSGDAPTVSWSIDGGEQSSKGLSISKLMPATDSTTVNFTAVASSAFCVATASKSVYTTTYPALKSKIDLRNADCSGTTKILSASVAGGKPDYSFVWSFASAIKQELTIINTGTYSVTVSDACANTVSSTLYVDAVTSPFTASFAQTDITCNGLDNGTVTVTASGGTTPFKYTISSGSAPVLSGTLNHLAPSVFANLAPGNYSISLTDGCGANIAKQIVITEPSPLISSITEYTNAQCNGKGDGTATVSVSGGTVPYTYIWDNGQRAAQSIGLMAGAYLVNVVDRNACLTTSSVSITEPNKLEASVFTANAQCHGESTGTASIQVAGGTMPYTYRWSNGLTVPSSDALAEGSYLISVADVCHDQRIIAADIRQPEKLVYSLTHSNISCNNASDGAANFALSGGTQPYSLMWDDSTTATYRTQMDAGTYRIYAGDACHDTIIDSVVIVQPNELTATIDTTPVSCSGSIDGTATAKVTGGTQPYSYLWSNGQKTPKAELLFASAYILQVLDAQGCLTSAQTIVTEPEPLNVEMSATAAACSVSTGSAKAIVSGGTVPYSYVWSNLADTSLIGSIPAGTYTVTVTDKNNCTASALAKVSVTVKQYPICLVTVDTASKSNRIVWEKDKDPSVDSWNIYSYYGSYRKIGAVKASDDYSTFDDFMAKPRQTSHQYAITTVDKCGNESPLSFSHSTMLAWSNYSTEPNKANIEWTPYFDESREFEPEYYYIFKGNDAKNMSLVDSVPGRSTVYIDEANDGAKYYRVGFTRKQKCIVTGLKSDSGPFSQSLSNLSESIILNAEELTALGMSVSVSPVPAADAATITVDNPQGNEFSLSISDLRGNVSEIATGIRQEKYRTGYDLQDVPSGTYLVQLKVGEKIFTHKLPVVK